MVFKQYCIFDVVGILTANFLAFICDSPQLNDFIVEKKIFPTVDYLFLFPMNNVFQ